MTTEKIPTGAPKDYSELYRLHHKRVEALLSRLDRKGHMHDELVQTVWQRLIEAQVIEKYRAKEAAIREIKKAEKMVLPSVVTAAEAAAMCGVTLKQWTTLQWRKARWVEYDNITRVHLPPEKWGKKTHTSYLGWCPEPCNEKEHGSVQARFWIADIFRYMEYRPFRRVHHAPVMPKMVSREVYVPVETPSKLNFNSYLAVAVANIFRNYCRTTWRRARETLTGFDPTNIEEGETPMESLWEDGESTAADVTAELREAMGKLSNLLSKPGYLEMVKALSEERAPSLGWKDQAAWASFKREAGTV